MTGKTRIAHVSGPRATIQNTPPLVTSNKARKKHGLPLRLDADGAALAFDALRPQRLAVPTKVYVEQFSAHPLESDAAELYGPPDGYVGADGVVRPGRVADDDKPVYEIELQPEDGLYPLPYMAVQADGQPWEEECAAPGAPEEKARQAFFPDGSRSFEEFDRLSVLESGVAGAISALALVDFYRLSPPGGYTKGLPAALRQDEGVGDIPAERRGRDFFPYSPFHLGAQPPRPMLAEVANEVQAIASSGRYDGVVWTWGSPQVEETGYWLSLLIDTTLPLCGNAAQRRHGSISNDGPKNVVDSIGFIRSRLWADDAGRNRCGAVLIQDQQIFAAREVAKVDARPGGFTATGGHGGILGQVSHVGRFVLPYLPAYRHTHLSDVNLSKLPTAVRAIKRTEGRLEVIEIAVKDASGRLIPDAIPVVSIIKDGSYSSLDFGEDPERELDLVASIDHKLGLGRLAGFVLEGVVPLGTSPSPARLALMVRATFSGLPVVRVGRNAPEAFTDKNDILIAGSNLTGTKARMLLLACLLKFGSLPAAMDPRAPTALERDATRQAVAAYQLVFDTH
jgi:L-asparaginase